ncbi:MAG TPA: ABC transporter ATP-binding protein, partial [Desulfurobacteriaceae bacterium]|nr:ABC transporter ATP-binding protein [Desulfurobacteriaceae bacterium]
TILGPNGAGKTTTLKSIMGLLDKVNGEIYFEGENITKLPPYKRVERGLVLVPEGRMIFPDLTVLENLEIGAYTPKARKLAKKNLEHVFKLFPRLKERIYQKAGTLSGGEQQMLAIGRGLMACPKLLILDEPSLGLAPKLVLSIFEIIKKLKEEGITILLVEQNVHLALSIADYGYILENGKIIDEGNAEKLEKDPKILEAYLGLT